MPKKNIYIGASSQGATLTEKEIIAAHVRRICEVIETEGYNVFADGGLKDSKIHKGARNVVIPKQYLPPESLVTSLTGLRLDGNADKLAYDIGMVRWVDDLYTQSLGCVFVVKRSNLGIGIEFLNALKIIQMQTLVLVDLVDEAGKEYPISSLVNGQTSRLLTVSRWRDETVKDELLKFLNKIESGLDRDMRFQISYELETWLKDAVQKYDFKNTNDLARYCLNYVRTRDILVREEK